MITPAQHRGIHRMTVALKELGITDTNIEQDRLNFILADLFHYADSHGLEWVDAIEQATHIHEYENDPEDEFAQLATCPVCEEETA
jgi:hypothetical protein